LRTEKKSIVIISSALKIIGNLKQGSIYIPVTKIMKKKLWDMGIIQSINIIYSSYNLKFWGNWRFTDKIYP
jgi:hypothetical protein